MSPSEFARGCGKRQTGQSTVEMIVVALAMIPMFLVTPLLGKYIDMMQATESASRYVAFEGTVHNASTTGWKTEAQLADEVRRRFFGPSDAPIKTGDVAGNSAAYRNPLWTTHRSQPLIADFASQVGVTAVTESKNVLPAVDLYVDEFDLPKNNLYTGTVSVTPSDVVGLAPFDSIGLNITRRTVVLVDPWVSTGPAQIRDKVRDSFVLFPTSGPAEALVNAIGNVPTLLFDQPLQLHQFDWDVVPCDRLSPAC